MFIKASISTILSHMLPSYSTGSRSFLSQLVMISTMFVLFIALLPHVSSSPTPSSIAMESNNNNDNHNDKVIYDSNAFMLDRNADPSNSKGDSSASSSVHEQQLSAPSSSLWFGQPRTHANQFLTSHVNDNEVVIPKWFTRQNNADDNDDNDDDDDDDINDYVPSGISINKRSSYYHTGGYQMLKKRKQVAKPPMEVMNEIVNSIYLKR